MTMLKPQAEAAIRTRFGSISGVSVRRIGPADSLSRTDDSEQIEILLECWSPTLNVIEALCYFHVIKDDDAETQAFKALRDHAGAIACQERRAAEGMELGTAAPFGIATVDGHASETKVGHILLDRGLAGLLETHGTGLLSEVRDSIWVLHQTDDAGRGVDEDVYEDNTTDDEGNIQDRQHVADRVLNRMVIIDDVFRYNGETLTAKRHLPSTVLNGIKGRRLGEVAEVPKAIADHVIAEAWEGNDGTTVHIRVEPMLASVTDILGSKHDETGGETW